MPTNREVVKGFLKEQRIRSANLTSNGDKLWSYNTCIAQWVKGQLIVNRTRYSSTTSGKHMSPLLQEVSRLGITILEVKGLRFNVSDLRDYADLDTNLEWTDTNQ